jgi:hypothetical protein
MRSLRGQLTPREGAGQLPASLLDVGPLPNQPPALRRSVEGRESACRSRTVGDPSHLSDYECIPRTNRRKDK